MKLSKDIVLEKEIFIESKDKNVEKFTYTKNGEKGDDKIDAISGATITSRAVTSAVNSCVAYSKSLKGGN